MIRETLDNLPEGLGGTYRRILVTISRSPLRAQLARKVFQWATIAQRPLHIEELKEAVAFSPHDDRWDEDKIPNESFMFESCRGLIIKDEDGTVHFAHHTVRQYLIGGLATKIDPNFEVSTRDADYLAGLTCVTYLFFSDFETQLTSTTPSAILERKGILESGGPLWIPSILGIRKPIFSIPYKMLRGDSASQASDFDYWKHLRPQPKPKYSPSTDLKDKYRLLCYAIENWEPHTRSANIHDPVYAHRVENLAKHKALAFDFRPWGLNQHFGPHGCVGCPSSRDQSPIAKDLPYISMIHYAARVDNLMLLTSHNSTEMKLKDYLHHERYHQETLLIACRHNKVNIVEYLLQLAKYDVSDGRAVNAAAAAGHADVLQCLLWLGQYQVKQQGHIPLLLAAERGHEAIILLLAEAGVDFFAYEERNRETVFASEDLGDYEPYEFRRPPQIFAQTATAALHLAVRYGHLGATRILLEHGGLIQDIGTHLAAVSGHSALVEFLLENNAFFPMVADETPVHLAAKNGHINVLETYKKWDLGAEFALNGKDQTPLHSAVFGGHDKAIRWLVENGVDVNADDSYSKTPLDYATDCGNEAAVRVLLELAATVFHGPGATVWRDSGTTGIPEERYQTSTSLRSAAKDETLAILQMLLDNIREDLLVPNDIKSDVVFYALNDARIRGSMKAAELLEQALDLYSEGKTLKKYTVRGIFQSEIKYKVNSKCKSQHKVSSSSCEQHRSQSPTLPYCRNIHSSPETKPTLGMLNAIK